MSQLRASAALGVSTLGRAVDSGPESADFTLPLTSEVFDERSNVM